MTRGALIDRTLLVGDQIVRRWARPRGRCSWASRRQPVAALCLGAAATAITYQVLARHWPAADAAGQCQPVHA